MVIGKIPVKWLVFFLFTPLLSCHSFKDQPPVLSVMTHSSFSSEFGPGPYLKKEFEKTCNCIVTYKNVGDAGLIVKKLQLGAKADVVMGLDQFSVAKMSESLGWKKTGIVKDWSPYVGPIKNLLPYDWSPMTFIYRKGEITPPQSWSQLLSNKKYEISLQDPRASTPGRQFLWWIYSLDRSFSKQLKALNQTRYRISPSWSTAYGLFKSGHTNIVFSYLSSLLYHWNEEKDFRYQAVSFEAGHPLQVEYMGVLASSLNDQLARDFIELVLSHKGQSILVKYNFMFPSVANSVSPISQRKLPQLKILDAKRWKDFVTHLDDHISSWEKSFR